ncbi:MAG: hypothetical protein ACFHU9_12270 [Fluviicola sp.]
MKYLLLIVGFTYLLPITGCSSPKKKAETKADEICDCVLELGIERDINMFSLMDASKMREIERKAKRELPRKLIKIFREIEHDIAPLSKEKKKEYTRALFKAMMDTECADIALDNLPYDMLGPGIDMMEERFDGR